MSDNLHRIAWNELTVRDTKAAREFYTKLCGWTYDTMPMVGARGDYYVAMKDGKPVAGILDISDMEQLAGIPAHWFTYIEVEDVRAALASIGDSGGKVLRDCFDIPGVGTIGVIADAAGAVVGLITPVASN